MVEQNPRRPTGTNVLSIHQFPFRSLEEERILAPPAHSLATTFFLVSLLIRPVPGLQTLTAATKHERINNDAQQALKTVLERGDGRADGAQTRLDER